MTMPSRKHDARRGGARGANALVATGARGAVSDRGPQRRCFVTRRTADKDALIRFIVGPDNAVVPDIAAKLPGRGLWLSADRNVVNTACAKSAFAKGFRGPVGVAADLADQVERQLARRCLDLLGLARRAGAAVAGFEKVRSLVGSGRAGVLVVASDSAEGGRRRADSMARGIPIVALHPAAELSAALGREHAVFVAVKKGPLAKRFVVEAVRLAGFRSGSLPSGRIGPEGLDG